MQSKLHQIYKQIDDYVTSTKDLDEIATAIIYSYGKLPEDYILTDLCSRIIMDARVSLVIPIDVSDVLPHRQSDVDTLMDIMRSITHEYLMVKLKQLIPQKINNKKEEPCLINYIHHQPQQKTNSEPNKLQGSLFD